MLQLPLIAVIYAYAPLGSLMPMKKIIGAMNRHDVHRRQFVAALGALAFIIAHASAARSIAYRMLRHSRGCKWCAQRANCR